MCPFQGFSEWKVGEGGVGGGSGAPSPHYSRSFAYLGVFRILCVFGLELYCLYLVLGLLGLFHNLFRLFWPLGVPSVPGTAVGLLAKD